MTLATALAIALSSNPSPSPPQPAQRLDTVQVFGQRRALAQFPGAVSVVDSASLTDGQKQVSLGDALQQVPGVLALERNNFAQDLQVQSRGFGARSTFGIRGLSLISNGIPATALDGQGQAASFALNSIDRVQVLRGPLALVHGNGAGGVIDAESVLDGRRNWRGGLWLGRDDSHRLHVRGDGGSADDHWRWRGHASSFHSQGFRAHSAATLRHAGAIAQYDDGANTQVKLVVDGLQQPWTQDPLGLTRSQWQAAPYSTDSAASTFNSRKQVDNAQAGVQWQQRVAGGHWHVNGWHSRRAMQQFLAIPVGAQMPATSAGGMIDLHRASTGLGVAYHADSSTGGWAVGVDAGQLREHRRGYENFRGQTLGVQGRLRRDERNRVSNVEPWAAWEQRIGALNLLAAGRHHRSRVQSRDAYIAPGNPDDSGRLGFSQTAFVIGVAHQQTWGELFASAGRGFETPTLNELAYRPDGSGGLNTDLRPTRFANIEAGLRWRARDWQGNASVYRIEGRDDIVPALSSGGRASFHNAARTRRSGAELAMHGALGAHWSWQLVGNIIDARFTESFSSTVQRGAVRETRSVPAGNTIPGIPRRHGFAQLRWHSADQQHSIALQAVGNSRIMVNDANTDSPPGHVRLNLSAHASSPALPGWNAFVRVDNLSNRRVIGSVIVNEANGRHFEPAAPRGLTIGLGYNSGR